METTITNSVLHNSNQNMRNLSEIDIIIITNALVKVYKDNYLNFNMETKKNEFIKLFIKIIQIINPNYNVDNLIDLVTKLNDNFVLINNLNQNELFLTNFCNLNMYTLNPVPNNIPNLWNVNILLFNKLLFDETYNFFKLYNDLDDSEKIEKKESYAKTISDILKKKTLSKIEYYSFLLGVNTLKKMTINISIDKILVVLNKRCYISDLDILQKINSIYQKNMNSRELNIENEIIDYSLVYEIINSCL